MESNRENIDNRERMEHRERINGIIEEIKPMLEYLSVHAPETDFSDLVIDISPMFRSLYEEEEIEVDYDPVVKSPDCFETIPKKKIKIMNFISKLNSKKYNQIKRDCKSFGIIINNKNKEGLSKELGISMMKKKYKDNIGTCSICCEENRLLLKDQKNKSCEGKLCFYCYDNILKSKCTGCNDFKNPKIILTECAFCREVCYFDV